MAGPPRLIAWASGKSWGQCHIDRGLEWRPVCGATVPDGARRCDSRSWETIRKLDSLCKSCLAVYGGTRE